MEQGRSGETGQVATPVKLWPAVRKIGIDDLVEAFGAGIRDFRAAPRFGLAIGSFCAGGGWLILLLLWKFELPYLAYPMAMGFVLVAPFVVTGLYDVSRRLERGEMLSWSAMMHAIWSTRQRDLRWMALISAFSLVIWMDIAALLSFGFLGFRPVNADLLNELFTTPSGLLFLLLGNVAGAMIAFFVFSISVVSFPMLFDRDIDFVTGIVTSVKSVSGNPWVMAVWCAAIAMLIAISIASAFVGLLVTLPVLGHASWHLYRRVVEPVEAG
ncbi:MAG: DUF2189 domain-containing protein [Hyphomicrobiaceae bacterium]